jgi:predicted transcriptional regulator
MNQNGESRFDAQTFAGICKALGHPARIRIVEHLKAIDHCVCGEIVQILPLAQSTVSQHLKVLKAAGLVKGVVEGPCTCYCLDREMLERFKRTASAI